MCACRTTIGVASSANAIFQCEEGMFHPRVADLFEALGVIGATAHTIKILWHDRVIGLRQSKPIDPLVAVITGVRPYRQTNLGPGAPHLRHIFDISNDNIRTRHKVRSCGTDFVLQGWHRDRLRLTISNLRDLGRLHDRPDRDCSGLCVSIRWSAHRVGKLF